MLKKRKEIFLFLDVDGVLNSNQYYENLTDEEWLREPLDRRCVEVLKTIVDETNAKIILTSSWRSGWNDNPDLCEGEGKILNQVFGEYGLSIFDKTPRDENYQRAKEIRRWLWKKNRKINGKPVFCMKTYIIIDDIDFGWKRYRMDKHVIYTDFEEGGLFGRKKQIEEELRKIVKG